MMMFQGDLKPDLQITLSGTDGVDVSDAFAMRIIAMKDGAILFDRPPDSWDVVGQTSVLSMQWQPSDTDSPGAIGIEVEVMWPGQKPQTFPADSDILITVDYDGAS